MSSGVWTIGMFSPTKRRAFFAQQQCSEASVSLRGGERRLALSQRTTDQPADARSHLFVRGRIQMPSHKESVEAYQFGFSAPGKIEFKVNDASGGIAFKPEVKACATIPDGRFPIERNIDRVLGNGSGRNWIIAG
jgi:hypothetical protein